MPNPNPLFLRWIKGFHAEKDYKIRGGPPRPTGYENAIQSLQNCTTRYEHPLEMKGLFGVGPTCIARLTEKLEEYCNERGLEMPEPPAKKTRGKAKAKAAPAPAKVDDLEKYANSEEEANPVKKPRARATKRKTRAKRQHTFTPEYANSEEEANPVKKPRTKVDPKAAARKAAEAGDAPEEGAEPTKKERAPRKTAASSAKRKRDAEEEDDANDNTIDTNPPAKTRRTSRRTKAPVSYAE